MLIGGTWVLSIISKNLYKNHRGCAVSSLFSFLLPTSRASLPLLLRTSPPCSSSDENRTVTFPVDYFQKCTRGNLGPSNLISSKISEGKSHGPIFVKVVPPLAYGETRMYSSVQEARLMSVCTFASLFVSLEINEFTALSECRAGFVPASGFDPAGLDVDDNRTVAFPVDYF